VLHEHHPGVVDVLVEVIAVRHHQLQVHIRLLKQHACDLRSEFFVLRGADDALVNRVPHLLLELAMLKLREQLHVERGQREHWQLLHMRLRDEVRLLLLLNEHIRGVQLLLLLEMLLVVKALIAGLVVEAAAVVAAAVAASLASFGVAAPVTAEVA
jgi:hypothetical protein